jgi:hypothetical protein
MRIAGSSFSIRPAPPAQRCRASYESHAAAPNLSPHSRFDVVDRLPLNP